MDQYTEKHHKLDASESEIFKNLIIAQPIQRAGFFSDGTGTKKAKLKIKEELKFSIFSKLDRYIINRDIDEFERQSKINCDQYITLTINKNSDKLRVFSNNEYCLGGRGSTCSTIFLKKMTTNWTSVVKIFFLKHV